MNAKITLRRTSGLLMLLGLTVPAPGQTGGTFDLSWSTLDSGGAMFSSGAGLELAGSVGQPDAQVPPVMSGGGFSLMGGFWPAANVCYCLGDMNGDQRKDALDVQRFVDCVISGGNCSCADVDAAGGVTLADVSVFVTDLLTGAGCPAS